MISVKKTQRKELLGMRACKDEECDQGNVSGNNVALPLARGGGKRRLVLVLSLCCDLSHVPLLL